MRVGGETDSTTRWPHDQMLGQGRTVSVTTPVAHAVDDLAARCERLADRVWLATTLTPGALGQDLFDHKAIGPTEFRVIGSEPGCRYR